MSYVDQKFLDFSIPKNRSEYRKCRVMFTQRVNADQQTYTENRRSGTIAPSTDENQTPSNTTPRKSSCVCGERYTHPNSVQGHVGLLVTMTST